MAFISLICCSMQKMLFLCDAFIRYACITAIFFPRVILYIFFLFLLIYCGLGFWVL